MTREHPRQTSERYQHKKHLGALALAIATGLTTVACTGEPLRESNPTDNKYKIYYEYPAKTAKIAVDSVIASEPTAADDMLLYTTDKAATVKLEDGVARLGGVVSNGDVAALLRLTAEEAGKAYPDAAGRFADDPDGYVWALGYTLPKHQ